VKTRNLRLATGDRSETECRTNPTPRSICVNAVDKGVSGRFGVNAVDKGLTARGERGKGCSGGEKG
jgi:hypothetical protein